MAPLHIADIGLVSWTLVATGLGVTYILFTIVYKIFFHPLHSFPGPLADRVSIIPHAYYLIQGRMPYRVAELHKKYGPIVRINPNELSFAEPQAWKDIYGHRAPGEYEFGKDPSFYHIDRNPHVSIISIASRERHGLIRRQLAHGFSDRSMREQEPIIGGYVDLFIRRPHENAAGGAVALNMRDWLNWTTFDIIGDLGFGSSFGCLKNSDYHPWVRLISTNLRVSIILRLFKMLGLNLVWNWVTRMKVAKPRVQHLQLVREKLQQRIELGAKRPDFIESLIKSKDGFKMSFDELQMNASALIIAGSETTATLLSGVVYLLTTNLDALKKLEQEVRSTFTNESQITLTSVNDLHYMLACLNESLRRYPPVVGSLPRVCPKGGAKVTGHFIPEGTKTAVWQWGINHDPSLWTDPMGFHPERFMNDPKFKGDKFDAMQPFSTGPRNCLGKNLAYAEMRLILARIVFNFDMSIADDSRDWLKGQKAYVLWDKPALNVYLKPVSQ